MAIAVAQTITSQSASTAVSYQTALHTPGGSGRLVMIGVFHAIATNANPQQMSLPTGNSISGANRINDPVYLNTSIRMELFRATSTGTAGAITFAMPESNIGCAWSVVELTGVDTARGVSGGLVTTNLNQTSSQVYGTAHTLALSAFSAVENGAIGFFGVGFVNGVTADTGWSELGEQGNGTLSGKLQTQFRATNDTSASVTTGTNSPFCGWAGEIWSTDAAPIASEKASPTFVYSQAVHRASRF